MLATAANLNTARGPWQGASWFQQLGAGAGGSYTATPGDPLIQASRRRSCASTAAHMWRLTALR
eukprot:11222758-Lingulodinium_polyedra.AAC.1